MTLQGTSIFRRATNVRNHRDTKDIETKPWGIVGFVINIVTGILFFIRMPFFYAWNPLFHLATVVVAGATLVAFNCTSFFQKLGEVGTRRRSACNCEVYLQQARCSCGS